MYFVQQLTFSLVFRYACKIKHYVKNRLLILSIYEQKIRYMFAIVNKMKVIKNKTYNCMLGTVHQHLFHALVCSDFILPDIHCTVH